MATNRWMQLAAIELQVLLFVAIFNAFRLESESFRTGIWYLAIAFPLHFVLPPRWRLPFFALISIGSVFLVAEWKSGLWILAMGGLLIGLCHVPVRFLVRVGLVVAAAVGLAVFRATDPEELARPWSDLVWPILGSMFMFRLVVYLYDLRHRNAPFGFWRSVAYFFMAPNVWFPLFPVVDYQTFTKTVKEIDRFQAHQSAMRWIFRGTIHLLLYRFVYQFTLVDPAAIDSIGSLFQFMLTTFLLYLRISGSFHLIAGLLRLFDFDLPETHHLYYLSSGFSDLWRRINIYWKDFIMKVFFYPLFFQLRKLGPTRALVGATLLSFAATWFFHSYQWFWLRGTLLVTPTDVAFWTILAVLVAINSVWESRPRKADESRLHKPEASELVNARRSAYSAVFRSKARLIAQTIGTFLVMCTLWTLWSATSFSEFFSILGRARRVRVQDVLFITAVLAVIGLWSLWESRPLQSALAARRNALRNSWRSVAASTALSIFLLILTLYPLQERLPDPAKDFLIAMENAMLNVRDVALLQRGYYEDLTQVHRFSHDLAIVYGERPPDYFVPWREAMREVTNDYFGEVLLPSRSYTYMDVHYSTNRWGMRDREYTKERPPGTVRLALIGSSYAMGWGVADDEVFETIAERELNAAEAGSGSAEAGDAGSDGAAGAGSIGAGGAGSAEVAGVRSAEVGGGAAPVLAGATNRYEILNFATHAYDPVRNLMVLEQRVLPFAPQYAILVCNTNERETLVNNLAGALAKGIPLPYPELQAACTRAGVDATTPRETAELKLAEVADDLIQWAFQSFAERCHEAGVVPVWLFMAETTPRLENQPTDQVPLFFDMARRAGFDVIADMRPAFFGVDGASLKLFPWDFHPNAEGHRMLAKQFLRILREDVLARR